VTIPVQLEEVIANKPAFMTLPSAFDTDLALPDGTMGRDLDGKVRTWHAAAAQPSGDYFPGYGGTDFSAVVWVYRNGAFSPASTSSPEYYIFGSDNEVTDSGSPEWCIHTGAGDQIRGVVGNQAHLFAAQTDETWCMYSLSVTLSLGSGSAIAKFYKNGVLANTTSAINAVTRAAAPARYRTSIGAKRASLDRSAIIGGIAHCSLFDKTLTTGEHLSLYTAMTS